jgi:hypothetical protein
VAADDRLDVAAGAGAAIKDGQQFGDVAKSQAEPLGALDQAQPVDGVLLVQAVASRRAGHWPQQVGTVVVTDGVGRDADPLASIETVRVAMPAA